MNNSILVQALTFKRNKHNYSDEEKIIIKKSILKEAEDILVNLIDKVNAD